MARQRYDVIALDDDGQEFVASQVLRNTQPSARNCKALANGRLAVRPRVEERADFNPATEVLEPQPPVIEEARVVYAWAARPLTEMERRLDVRARRAELYRERLGKLPSNTDRETMGDVHDETLEFFAVNRGLLSGMGFIFPEGFDRVLTERAAIKQEVPLPAGVTSSGRKKV